MHSNEIISIHIDYAISR